jgi:hypothetical protein
MLTGDGKGILTNNQLTYLYNAVDNIIERLPEKALNQLLEGYGNDVDTMLREMVHQSEKALYLGRTMDSESLSYVDNVKASMDNTLKILSLNYFITTMLPKFRLGWRNIEWGNLTQLYPWSCYLCARASGKCMSADTLVVMYDGSLKKIQDIEVGDKVMGVDSTPRTVLQLHKGVAPMYRVKQSKGMTYEVNEGHLLCCYYNGYFIDVEVDAVYRQQKDIRKLFLGYKVKDIGRKEPEFDYSSLKITPIGEGEYYGFACDGDHKFLLEDGTVVHNSFQWSYAFILWRLWSYTRPTAYRQDTTDNANRKETCYITNTFTLAKVQIAKVTEEIEANDLIKEKLNPYNKASIGETAIKTETGSTLHVRGKDSMIRGLHVGACLCDDMPDESSLYSDEQREKLKELLKGTIEPIVEPYGYFLVTGTPYSSAPNELYQVLKADKRFYCFEYPILFPDGRPLAPDRYTFEQILAKKEELGTIVFNREYLVVPISDTSTIFPYEYLMRSIIGMETIRFASSIDDFPFKLTRVHIGVDFAVSGNIGADYTVYSVWGKDAMDNYYLLYYYRKRGMSHNEQVDKIVQLDRLFHPNKIRCEANGFQSILSGMAKERGLKNIEPFTTTEGNKKDLYTGLPSLSAMFERGQIKCPYAMGETRQAVDLMFGEFSSITFRSDNGKLEAASGHDDVVMANFLAINSLREDDKEVQVSVALI